MYSAPTLRGTGLETRLGRDHINILNFSKNVKLLIQKIDLGLEKRVTIWDS